jgi:photosystem II stability/assembly factor-like uncharacterized protein
MVKMKLLYSAAAMAPFLSLPSVLAFATHPSNHHGPAHLSWTLAPTNSTQQFRGLSPISKSTVWVAGTNSSVLRTTNGGATWSDVSPVVFPENSTLFQFRDIHAFSASSAVILSIGEANASRIYLTHDAGKTWKLTFINEAPTAFYDCLAFEDAQHGLAMSDPVDGKFRIIETWDGGATWNIVDSAGIPSALEGEFGFAASGTCIEAKAGRWYIAAGGVDPGRIFRSADGKTWEVSNASITGGAAAGVFSVRFRDSKHGIAVGGDFEKPTGNVNNAAWSEDGGATWRKAESFPGGYRSGASWVPGSRNIAVAVGTSGSDITLDGGENWRTFDNGTFDAVECIEDVCWASGSRGRVAQLDIEQYGNK